MAEETPKKNDNPETAEEKNGAPQPPAAPVKPKHPLTWERSIEILKVLATVWVALIGTIVTMQFNERQHELNRIEAIAKMLPHLDDDPEPAKLDAHAQAQPHATVGATTIAGKTPPHPGNTSTANGDMSRDGAIWAIFRTANNKTMLRDLASLFPEDIYRVVSSVAVAGSLEADDEALTALEVASEKLATKYTSENSELAARLYNQALRLRQRRHGEHTPVYIVDITDTMLEPIDPAHGLVTLISSVNKLGAVHLKESETHKGINANHYQAKQLYKRARKLGLESDDKDVKLEVAIADLGLAELFMREGRYEAAIQSYKEARDLQVAAIGAGNTTLAETNAKLAEAEKQLAAHKAK